jgi:hypothetical protein
MNLLTDNIVGIIDSYGAVHSINTGEDVENHDTQWPCTNVCKWRWSHRQSIWWILSDHKPDIEQQDAIMRHLTRKYGIKWWDNGHHDIDDLIRRFG